MGPITVVASGSNVNNATGTDILLNSNIPFTKLDTQNPVSFQTITLSIVTEPANYSFSPGYAITTLYKFPHGYTYVPSVWFMWQNNLPLSPNIADIAENTQANVTVNFGDDTSASNLGAQLAVNNSFEYATHQGTFAYNLYNDAGADVIECSAADLFVTVDSTNVYINVVKSLIQTDAESNIIPILLSGITINIRIYVFTEPGTTSTY